VKNLSQGFAGRLRALRGDRSKSAFARALGISNPSTYQNYEAGRIPDAQAVQAIATKCGVSIAWLLSGEGPPPAGLASGAALQLRERGAGYAVAGERQPPPPLCRFPADCDLVERLDRMEAQIDTLVRLLGATLAGSSPPAVAGERKKAG
jgi:transcriptional regulator with XRE-family HTH domain